MKLGFMQTVNTCPSLPILSGRNRNHAILGESRNWDPTHSIEEKDFGTIT